MQQDIQEKKLPMDFGTAGDIPRPKTPFGKNEISSRPAVTSRNTEPTHPDQVPTEPGKKADGVPSHPAISEIDLRMDELVAIWGTDSVHPAPVAYNNIAKNIMAQAFIQEPPAAHWKKCRPGGGP